MLKQCGSDATEGDVETQVVLPIIQERTYLSVPKEFLKSKEYLAPRDIDKGRSKKSGYYPDFAVYIRSLPICVVEVKSPSNSTEDAYIEGSLYAHEINRSYKPNVNPCQIVIGTNGITLRAGHWDSDPLVDCRIDELLPGSAFLDKLCEIAEFHTLETHAKSLSKKIRIENFKRPFNQGEGTALINSKIGTNTFSADLQPILRRYFTSHDQSGDHEIFERAYIPSSEVASYDRSLEAFLKDRIIRSTAAGRTELKPTKKEEANLGKAVSEHFEERPIGGALQLITGAVGAGKTLFARRYKEFLQPQILREKNHWSFINFNDAPPQLSGAEEWVCDNFFASLVTEGAPINIADANDQERLFAPNLVDRKPFYERMNSASSGRGDLERARDIEQWRHDPETLSECASRYLQGDRGENLIVVFDNVDRRDTDDQLACFQLALWFMAKTRALLLLQMRDVTFERFKNEPPLDTYRSGTIFHISPPRFIDVVRRRLELSLEYMTEEAPEKVSYTLPTGAKVSYPKSRAGEFLNAVYSEIFQRPRNIATIIEALSGKDVRRSLDMFMSIINSGHMPEDLISSVAQGMPHVDISEYLIIKILMRGDYKFHNENSGFISNIFFCENSWERPSNFLLGEILFWLIRNRKIPGDNGQMGYFSIARIADELEAIGFVREDVHKGATHALKKGLVEADTLSLEILDAHDCIKATASGWVHMRILPERSEYLHSVLPTTPIFDADFRVQIFESMRIENQYGNLRVHQINRLVQSFHKYLKTQKRSLDKHHEYPNRDRTGANYLIEKVQTSLERNLTFQRRGAIQPDLLDN